MSDPTPVSDRQTLQQQLSHLSGSMSLAARFPYALEQQFRAWLHARTMVYVRQYLRVVIGLYTALIVFSVIKIKYFTAISYQTNDYSVLLWTAKILGASILVYALCARRPHMDRYFWLYSGVIDIVILTVMSLCTIALNGPQNIHISMAIVIICFLIIFGTGMLMLRYCITVAVSAFLLTLAGAWWLARIVVFFDYTLQFMLVFAGMTLICQFVIRNHRQVFLHEQLLLDDKQELLQLSKTMSELSQQDALTGLANRRCFDAMLQSEWERGRRQSSCLSLLFVDIDFFKIYNDRYGHQAGDACLHAVAQVLQAAVCRPADLVARYGGEEFVLLLPDTNMVGAQEIAERICTHLRKAAIPHVAVPQGWVSVSIGVAARQPDTQTTPQSLLAAADQALYAAKASGRGIITCHQGLADFGFS